MSMNDLSNYLRPSQLMHTGVNKTADVDSSAVDRQGTSFGLGFNALDFIISVGPHNDTFSSTDKITLSLIHSDDDGSTDPYAVVTQALGAVGPDITSGGLIVLDADAACQKAYHIGYSGAKRYVKVRVDFAGTHSTGTDFAIVCIGALPAMSPTAAS